MYKIIFISTNFINVKQKRLISASFSKCTTIKFTYMHFRVQLISKMFSDKRSQLSITKANQLLPYIPQQQNKEKMQFSDVRYQQKSRITKKVGNEELAISSQLKKYKQTYQNQVIHPASVQTFTRFSKQLILLLISHCKNIVLVAPERVSNSLEEISNIFDDIVNKYYQASLKLNDRTLEMHKVDNKLGIESQLCAVCAQQIKKVHIDQMRRVIFNENQFAEKDNCQQPKDQEEDHQFFTELNDLLNRSYGEVLKNRMEIDLYQDVALSALNSLSSLKNYFSRDSVLIPNSKWIEEARAQMQGLIKQNFNGKIPPWIQKMFGLFWAFHRKQMASKQKQEGVQTISNTNSQVIELKKRIYKSKEQLQKTQIKVQHQQHEIANVISQKQNLEVRVDYYKTQLNKLLDEIQAIKSQNKNIRMKLNSQIDIRASQNVTNTEISYLERDTVLIQSSRSKKRTIDHANSLPKIVRSSGKKRPASKKRDSQTSIKMLPLQSQYKTQRKHSSFRKTNISGISNDEINKENQQNIRSQIKAPTIVHTQRNQTIKDAIIKQEEGEATLEEEKKKIMEVSEQIKNMVKTKFDKNGYKGYLNSNINTNKGKQQLKKVPRSTNKLAEYLADPSNYGQKHSIYKTHQDPVAKSQAVNNMLVKIYNYLREEGFLIKLSEQQFKQNLSKIDLLGQTPISADQCQSALESRLSSHNHSFQRFVINRKSWNEETFHIQKQGNEMFEKYRKKLHQQYFSIFANEQNAYNYELSLTKNHYKGVHRMTKIQQKACEQLYQIVSKIKVEDFQHYKFICSYLRYPYQVIKNDFGVVNMVNEMKYQNFHQYFQRLLGIHVKCKKEEGVCQHFAELKSNFISSLQKRISID